MHLHGLLGNVSPSLPAPATAFQAGQPAKDWQMGRELVLFRAQSPAPSLKQEELIIPEMYRPLIGGMRLDLGTNGAHGTQAESTVDGYNLERLLAQLPRYPTHPRKKFLSQVRAGSVPYNPGLSTLTLPNSLLIGKVKASHSLLEGGRRGKSMSATSGQTGPGKVPRLQPKQTGRQGQGVCIAPGEQYHKTPFPGLQTCRVQGSPQPLIVLSE